MSKMNRNSKLYEQVLYYNEHAYPYQCLAQPWWVRTDPPPPYHPRHGCKIETLNCGERVFNRIARDLRQAKRSVDIITWGFDPGMELVRDGRDKGLRYGDLLMKIASRDQNPVQVRLVVWHDHILTQRQMKNIPGFYGTRFPSIGCASGGYYDPAHQRYNAEWFEQVSLGAVPNIGFHVRELPDSLLAQLLSDESSPWTPKAIIAKMYPTHHQKMLLIDYEDPESAIGYVMGHNSITDFWDTDKHLFQDPRRELVYKEDPALEDQRAWRQGPSLYPGTTVPRYAPSQSLLDQKQQAVERYVARKDKYKVLKPYQDVSCRLRGPVLHDLKHNFCEAWQESERPTSLFISSTWLIPRPNQSALEEFQKAMKQRLVQEQDPDFVARRKKIKLKAYTLTDGEHSVQLLRTQPLHGEKTIKECYANLTRQINHYIFIQNQYIQYEPWAEHLKECVQRLRAGGYQKPVYVFILTSTPESDGMDEPTYGVAKELGQSATMTWEHDEAVDKARRGKGPDPITPAQMAKRGINVVMGSLWTCATPSPARRLWPDDYEEIYIHSKVAIVDDAAFTLGSANLNLRSMAMDSELNVLSQSHEVAYQLRTDLFEQCTGKMGPEKFGDMKNTFDKWEEMMSINATKKTSGQMLASQIVLFQVERKPGSPIV